MQTFPKLALIQALIKYQYDDLHIVDWINKQHERKIPQVNDKKQAHYSGHSSCLNKYNIAQIRICCHALLVLLTDVGL